MKKYKVVAEIQISTEIEAENVQAIYEILGEGGFNLSETILLNLQLLNVEEVVK